MAPPVYYQEGEDQSMLSGEMEYNFPLSNAFGLANAPDVEPDTISDESLWDLDKRTNVEAKTYTVLGANKPSQDLSSSDSAVVPSTVMQYGISDESYQALDSWRYIYPRQWNNGQVMSFLHNLCEISKYDIRNFHGENFRDVDGERLCSLSEHEFVAREPKYGHDIYRCIRRMLQGLETGTNTKYDNNPMFSLPSPNDDLDSTDYSWSPTSMQTDIKEELDSQEYKVKIGTYEYPLDPDPRSSENLPLLMPQQHYSQQLYRDSYPETYDEGYDSSLGSSGSYYSYQMASNPPAYSPGLPFSTKADKVLKSSRKTMMKAVKTPRRKPRDHSSSFSSDYSSDSDLDVKPARRGKGNRLWEFIAGLLKNSQYNPRIIRWEDKKNSIFRIVQSEAVAAMWGGKKNNEKMTYEKLSRALRFSRTAGYFADVPKTGQYPKKLCFKFGDRAVIDF